jgi:hypothetical protein
MVNTTPKHFVPFVKPTLPQTAPVPISERDVAKTTWKALPPHYTQSDVFVGQVRPTLATLPSGTATGFSPAALSSQPPTFKRGDDFTAPAKFGLITAAVSWAAAWTPNSAPNAQPLDFAAPSLIAPDKFGIYIAPTTFLNGPSTGQQGGGSSVPRHFSASTPKPVNPQTQAPATPTVDSWLATLGVLAQPQQFADPSITSPDKTPTSAVTLSFAWRSQDPYVPKFDWYAMGDTSTGPSATATAAMAFVSAIEGLNAQPQKFAGVTFSAPDKFGLTAPATPTIAGWLATLGVLAQPQQFADPSFTDADKVLPFQPAIPTLASWTSTLGQNAQPQKFWQIEIARQTQPTLATLPIFLSDLTAIPRSANAPTFAPGSTFSAPDKFGLVVAAVTFVSAWTPTLGPQAQPLDYDRGNVTGPDKANLIAPAIVFLPGWQDTDGAEAVKFTFTQTPPFAGPDKVLPFFVAPPTIAGWQSTNGQKAVPQLATPGSTFSSPVLVIITPGPFALIAQKRSTYEAWSVSGRFRIVTN